MVKITLNYFFTLLIFLFTAIIFSSCQKELREIVSNNSNNDTTVSTNPDTTINYSNLFSVTAGNGQDTGEILLDFNTEKNAVLAILDQSGKVLKAKNVALQVDNFQRWNINGKIRYSYFQTDGPSTIDSIPGTEEGYEIICDSNLNPIKRITLLPYGNVDTTESAKIDVHEFILLDDDHYIVEAYRSETPTNIPDSLEPSAGEKVVGCIIQEINNGQVIFQWHGTDHPEFYGESVENNVFGNPLKTMDYMHLNSICIDPDDNNLIISCRNLNQIIKLNRTTAAVMWRLGGKGNDFAFNDDEIFLRQHFARITGNDHTLIFLDNGLAGIRPYSRVLEFHLDEINKKVTSFSAYKIPDQFIQYGGSVQKMNGYYFIGGSAGKYALQVNYTTNEVLLRLNQNYVSYRCLKYNF